MEHICLSSQRSGVAFHTCGLGKRGIAPHVFKGIEPSHIERQQHSAVEQARSQEIKRTKGVVIGVNHPARVEPSRDIAVSTTVSQGPLVLLV